MNVNHVDANATYGAQLQIQQIGTKLRIRLPFHVENQPLGNFSVQHGTNNQVLVQYTAYGQGFNKI